MSKVLVESSLTSSQELSVQVGQSSRERMRQTTAAYPVQCMQTQISTQRTLEEKGKKREKKEAAQLNTHTHTQNIQL